MAGRGIGRANRGRTGKAPSTLDGDDLHAEVISAFLDHLEEDRPIVPAPATPASPPCGPCSTTASYDQLVIRWPICRRALFAVTTGERGFLLVSPIEGPIHYG
jgi:hypothetical protein